MASAGSQSILTPKLSAPQFKSSYQFVEDGALAYAVDAAQDVDVRLQIPHNVVPSAPKAENLDSGNVFCNNFCHVFWVYLGWIENTFSSHCFLQIYNKAAVCANAVIMFLSMILFSFC